MIKVGDRVRVYDWNGLFHRDNKVFIGTVNKIDDKGLCLIISSTNKDDLIWVFNQQFRKLIMRKKYSEVKVGDRVVITNPFIGSCDDKGYIAEIGTNHMNVIVFHIKFDHGKFGFYFRQSFKKLIEINKPKFKVGDRVHAVVNEYKGLPYSIDIKGTIENIDDEFSKSGIYLYKLKENIGWFRQDTLKRLAKKKVEFKVGDRIIFGDQKGKIRDIYYNLNVKEFRFLVRLDNGMVGVFPPSKCKKLIKKEIQFKVGDRVSAGGQKGTIKQFHAKSDLAYVKFDNVDNSFIMAHPIDEFKKLRKKKIEFKVDDRISFNRINSTSVKGTIKHIYDNKNLSIKFDCGNYTIQPISYTLCKKLIKKKTQFKVGDRVNTAYGKGHIEYIAGVNNPHFQIKLDNGNSLNTCSDVCKKLVKKKKEVNYKCIKPELKFDSIHKVMDKIVENAIDFPPVRNREYLNDINDNLNKWNEFFEKNSYKVVRKILNDIDKRLSMLEGFQSLNADRFARIERSIKDK